MAVAVPWTNSATDAGTTPAELPFAAAFTVVERSRGGNADAEDGARDAAASTTDSSTPRRLNRCASRLRAVVSRLESVPSFSPSVARLLSD